MHSVAQIYSVFPTLIAKSGKMLPSKEKLNCKYFFLGEIVSPREVVQCPDWAKTYLTSILFPEFHFVIGVSIVFNFAHPTLAMSIKLKENKAFP